MNCIAIIPARGGSKRIPRKNIRDFLRKPVIAYSIEAAIKSEIFDEVMVSTDDNEIAKIAKDYGANVPFFRSYESSTDTASTIAVLTEVLSEYSKTGKTYINMCCIYPCAPFVTAGRLRNSYEKFIADKTNSAFPVVKFSYPPQRCLVIRNGKVMMLHPKNYTIRSQEFEPLYHDAGQFYFGKCDVIVREKRLFCENSTPIVLPESEVQDIDTEEDWIIAEMKYKILQAGR